MRRSRVVVVLTLLLATAAGCQSTVTTSDGRPPPPRLRRAPDAPPQALANHLFLRVGMKAVDTNGNSYPDLIPVEAHLFADPHPSPVYEPGALVFALYPDGRGISGTPMAQWRIEPDALEAAKITSSLGLRGYGLRLSLLDIGSDRYPLMRVNLIGWFEPTDGRAFVRPAEPCTLQIGLGRGG